MIMANPSSNMSGRLFHTNGKVATRAELTAMIIHGQNPLLVNLKTDYCEVLVPSWYVFNKDGLVSDIEYTIDGTKVIISLVE